MKAMEQFAVCVRRISPSYFLFKGWKQLLSWAVKINSTVSGLKCGLRWYTYGLTLHTRASFWASVAPSRSPGQRLPGSAWEAMSSTGLPGTFGLISQDTGSLYCLIRLKPESSPWMKIALGAVDPRNALADLYSIFLFFLIIVVVSEARFSQITLLQSLS